MTTCPCDGHGLVKIAYKTGEPFDVAICDCASGQRLRWRHETHPEWLRRAFRLEAETRIAWLEDFEDAPHPPKNTGELRDFLEAGKVGKRARL